MISRRNHPQMAADKAVTHSIESSALASSILGDLAKLEARGSVTAPSELFTNHLRPSAAICGSSLSSLV